MSLSRCGPICSPTLPPAKSAVLVPMGKNAAHALTASRVNLAVTVVLAQMALGLMVRPRVTALLVLTVANAVQIAAEIVAVVAAAVTVVAEEAVVEIAAAEVAVVRNVLPMKSAKCAQRLVLLLSLHLQHRRCQKVRSLNSLKPWAFPQPFWRVSATSGTATPRRFNPKPSP